MPIPRKTIIKPATDAGDAADAGDVQPDNVQSDRRIKTRTRTVTTGPKWRPLSANYSHYAIVVSQGVDQTGKTDWALTAPEPILVMTFDPDNYERGPAKRYAHKNIQMATFELPKGLLRTSELAEIAAQERDRWEDTYTEAIEGDMFRTIILDREDETWELFRYEEFDGKQSAKPHHFTPLNSHYKALLKKAAKHQKNLIMIDATFEEWKNEKPTGKLKRHGFKNLGMLAQLHLEHIRDAYDNFSIQVISCRDNARMNGLLFDAKFMETVSQELADRGIEWPVDEATGEPRWFDMDFSNMMAYMIGGTPDEWR